MFVQMVPLCFVTRADYPKFRRIAKDGYAMPDSYDVYLARLQNYAEALEEQGGVAYQIYIKPAELLRWCDGEGREVTADARGSYALMRLKEFELSATRDKRAESSPVSKFVSNSQN
jgi:hypothetical protein